MTDTPPSGWLATWLRDERFWRDVTSNTLAGVAVVTVTVVAGWASGILKVPGEAVAVFAGVVVAGLGVSVWVRRPKRGPKWVLVTLEYLALALVLFGAMWAGHWVRTRYGVG